MLLQNLFQPIVLRLPFESKTRIYIQMKIYTSVCVFVRGMKMGDKKAQANCVVFDSFRHITMRFIVSSN